MHEILMKAYADGIVESLKARGTGPICTPFAAVDLGEENIERNTYTVQAKFYWETTSEIIGSIDHTLQVVLRMSMREGLFCIESHIHGDVWTHLTPDGVASSTDVLVQLEARS